MHEAKGKIMPIITNPFSRLLMQGIVVNALKCRNAEYNFVSQIYLYNYLLYLCIIQLQTKLVAEDVTSNYNYRP